MDPALAKQLLDNGSITPQTYYAAVGVTPAPMGNYGSNSPADAPAAPPAPQVNPSPQSPPSYEDATLADVGKPTRAPTPMISAQGTALVSGAPKPVQTPPRTFSPDSAPEQPAQEEPSAQPGIGETASDPKIPNATAYFGMKAPSAPAQKGISSGQLRENQLSGRVDTEEKHANDEQSANQRIAAAESDGAQKASFMINQQLNDEDAAIKRRDAFQLQAYNLAQDTYKNLADKYKALGDKTIDPDRKWKSLDAGGKFAVGASIALGGIASGLGDGRQGGRNVGLDMWQQKVNQDIASQADAIQNSREALNSESNIAAKQYALSGDMVGYYHAKQVEGWMQVQHRVEALANETKSEAVKAQLEKMRVELDRKVDGARNNLQDYQYGRLGQQEQMARQAAAAQAAKIEAQKKQINERSWKLQTESDKSPDEADRIATRSVLGVDVAPEAGSMRIPSSEEMKLKYHPDAAGKDKPADIQRELQAGYDEGEEFKSYFGTNHPGNITSKIPGVNRIPGSDAQVARQKVDDWNNYAVAAIGSAVKVINGGKPGAVELRHLETQIQMTPDMSDKEKLARVNRMQALQKQAAKMAGAKVGPDNGGGKKAPSVNDVKFE